MIREPNPKVLVLLPAKNGERFLAKQINSILAQESVDVYFLCGDDDSTDSTLQILSNLCGEKIVGEVIQLGGKGSSQAFSQLTEIAPLHFDFFAYSDQDDIWISNKLIKSIEILGSKAPKIAISARSFINSEDSVINRNDNYSGKMGLSNALVENIAFGNTIVMNLEGMKILKKFLPGKTPYFDSWLYLLFSSIGSVERLSEPLVQYRLHADNLVGVNSVSGIAQARRSIKNKRSQVEEFREKLDFELDSEKKELIDNFLSISKTSNFLEKIRIMRKLNIVRQKKLHTLATCILLLTI
jgi:glycosyltransferase involved in cell wall biosynthesis